MGARRGLKWARTFLAVLCVGVCLSCKRKVEERPKVQEAPVDHLLPGEIVEGREHAFGLPLPREAHVATRFAKSAHVTSTVTPEQLANFVRARVAEGKITSGSSASRFESVVPRDDKNKRLTVDVRPLRTGGATRSEMIVQDITPPPFDPSLTEEERWKKAGLTPSGKLLDPTHLE